MAAICHIRLSKIKNFNFASGAGDQQALQCQKLIKIGQKVAEIWWLNGFQNGICPPSWIFEIQFLTVWEVKRPIFHHHTKLRKDRSHRCGDIAIFVIFKMVAAAILDFQKFEICRGRICVTVPNFIIIDLTVAEIWRFYGFHNGGRPPS